MPSYKFTYFDSPGRAEVSRLLFAVSGKTFVDERVSEQQWTLLKSTGFSPIDMLPVLTVTDYNGSSFKLAQSLTIARYLARKFQLCGRDEMEQALVEMLLDHINEIFDSLEAVSLEKNRVQQIQLFHKFTVEFLPSRMQFFENLLNKSPSGFLVGKYLTVADLFLMTLLDTLISSGQINQDQLFYYKPNIVNHRQKMRYIPGIMEWKQKHN